MSGYYKPKENEWVYPRHNGYKLACCDCGLVHDMDFRVLEGKHVAFRVRRNERSTAGMRRGSVTVIAKAEDMPKVVKAVKRAVKQPVRPA